MRKTFSFVLALTVLCACSSGQSQSASPSPPPAKGTVAGKLTLFQGAGTTAILPPLLIDGRDSLAQAVAGVLPPRLLTYPGGKRVVPGEFIVRFAEANVAPQEIRGRLAVPGYRVDHRGHASQHLHLIRLEPNDGQALSIPEMHSRARELVGRPGVVFVEENRVYFPTAVPNDRGYSLQWHYPAMNLPAAWDLTQGSSTVVVAVVDTGIVPHADLDARVVPGINMITDPVRAGNGVGRTDDPTDMGGDEPNGGSSWHGTHVAGTIGALTNNTVGVAGVDWNCRILPVRVLGKGGGTLFDIASGIVWAAGGSVPGSRPNANPAKVINMSLGGSSPPSQVYQDAIDTATAAGAIVVVAAGNNNENTASTTPCNQQNVICVGATGFSGTRAPYSNFGAEVDVMAPGGDMTVDLNGDGYPDGVLSTYRDAQNQPSYQFLQGTSMASPHVAGLVALMKSVRPGLSFAEAKNLLKQTANAQFKCNEGCGAGLVNAHAAVLAAKSQVPTGNPKLALSATDLYFAGSGQSAVIINNVGGANLTVSVAAGGAAGSKLSFPAGSTYTVQPGKSANLVVVANASGLPQGISLATVRVNSNGGNAIINVRINVGTGPATKEAVLAVVYQDAQGKWQAAGGGKVLPSSNYQYSFQVDPGTYYVVGAVDERGNGQFFEPGDRVGFYKGIDNILPVNVTAGQTTSGIDFALIPFKGVNDRPALVVGAPCTANGDCPEGGVCLNAPGGYCSRNCASEACPAGSKCYALGDNTFYCLANCPGPRQGQSTCRTSYVCESDGTGLGACIPACTSNADCAPSTCNISTGYCN